MNTRFTINETHFGKVIAAKQMMKLNGRPDEIKVAVSTHTVREMKEINFPFNRTK